MNTPLFGETGGCHPLARWVDHSETYGRHVVERFAAQMNNINTVVDIGAGQGHDLNIFKTLHPKSQTIAIEAGHVYAENLRNKVDQIHVLNIETAIFPFKDESIDVIIANQVLEHTKEIFWIFDQVTRSLRGGYFLFGIPNILSLHNRLMMLFGVHPTQHKLCSAHVRCFSKNETMRFIDACFPGGYRLVQFAGSQFYPFPAKTARLMSKFFPTLSFSIFFLIQRTEKVYNGEFASYPARANFETNFFTGIQSDLIKSQYHV